MDTEQIITEERLWGEFRRSAGDKLDLTGFKVVYAWKESFWGEEEHYALAFHPGQTSLWTLNIGSGLLREIQLKNIRCIKEWPSCRYQFFYLRSLWSESFYVPYISAAEGGRFRCTQLEAGRRFHMFCKALARKPWHKRQNR